MKIINYCNKLIEYSFYSLMFLVPLTFASDTFELFEFNKMWLTFALTIIIGGSWVIKMVRQSRIFIQRTPLDIPIALFLLSQIISTIFSWDQHISIWGYYSRFNGGLLSIISYIFLYYAFLSNFHEKVSKDTNVPKVSNGKTKAPFDTSDTFDTYSSPSSTTIVKRLLFVSLFSGLVVALWGLPSHFGYDPTCLLFRGTLDVSCWTADFQPKVRIFSTLGQPDWLAAYLAILLPISIIMFIKSIKNIPLSIFPARLRLRPARQYQAPAGGANSLAGGYLLLSALFYLDLLYTGARSGVLAAWLSLIVLLIAYLWEVPSGTSLWIERKKISNLLPLFVVFITLGIITFFVGQPFPQLNKFTLEGIKKSITNTQSTQKAPAGPPATQAELAKALRAGEFGGTDSSKIRKIVWQGAIDVWQKYPIFGTGVETFAFAYYRFKPQAHNLTSEWNFLYNKAHNEYLNYLATTGLFGLGSYLLMILWFLFLTIKKLKTQNSKLKTTTQNSKLEKDRLLTLSSNFELCTLNFALLAGYISILVTNFFGFSVVITNIYLFMIPAFVFILGGMINLKKQFVFPSAESGIIARISPYQWTFIFSIALASCFLILNLFKYWMADKAYSLGYNLDRAGEYKEAYPHLQKALDLRAGEPVFKDELAINNAVLAGALLTQEDAKTSTDTATFANKLGEDAIALSNLITSKYPNNVVFWKSRVRVFYSLGQVDSRYLAFALEAIKNASQLAPTDANISYNLGVLYGQNGDVKNGIQTLEKTIKLKPDYRDAYYALGLFYRDAALDKEGKVVNQESEEKAVAQMKYILTHISQEDTAVKEILKSWGEK